MLFRSKTYKIYDLVKYNGYEWIVINVKDDKLTLMMKNCLPKEKVKKILIELDNYKIKGVLYYDVAVLNIYRSLKLKYDLVWGCEHYATNYNTINYWHSFGVNYAYLSSDITLQEIIDITKNTKSKLMVNLFGYLPMFVSKRHIVKNYLNYFKDRKSVV